MAGDEMLGSGGGGEGGAVRNATGSPLATYMDAAPPLSSGGAGGTSEGLPIEPILIGFVYVYRASFVVTVASGEPVEDRCVVKVGSAACALFRFHRVKPITKALCDGKVLDLPTHGDKPTRNSDQLHRWVMLCEQVAQRDDSGTVSHDLLAVFPVMGLAWNTTQALKEVEVGVRSRSRAVTCLG